MPAPRGNSYAVDNDGGAPEGNQNAQSHGLYASTEDYFGDLDDDEQRWVVDMHQSLLARYRRMRGDEPDKFDTESLKNIAIDFHRVAGANGWYSEHGLVHGDESDDFDELKINEWASEIRRLNESIYERMDKHGLLPSPEAQKADVIRSVDVTINELGDTGEE